MNGVTCLGCFLVNAKCLNLIFDSNIVTFSEIMRQDHGFIHGVV